MESIVKKLMENRVNESLADDPMLEEDLKKYVGKPMKELLQSLNGKVKIDITFKGKVSWYGSSGFNGRANQVTWDYADQIIEDAIPGDGKYVDVKVIL